MDLLAAPQEYQLFFFSGRRSRTIPPCSISFYTTYTYMMIRRIGTISHFIRACIRKIWSPADVASPCIVSACQRDKPLASPCPPCTCGSQSAAAAESGCPRSSCCASPLPPSPYTRHNTKHNTISRQNHICTSRIHK